MEIKPLTHKELNKLLKLKCNKNFKENFSMFLPRKMDTEITFVAIEDKEIVGAISYSHAEDKGFGKITVGDKEFNHTLPLKFLEFIEVKPTWRRKNVAKQMLEHLFDICHTCEYGLRISNLVLDGKNLIPVYNQLSEKYQVDLFYSPCNPELKNQHKIFSTVPIAPAPKRWKLW